MNTAAEPVVPCRPADFFPQRQMHAGGDHAVDSGEGVGNLLRHGVQQARALFSGEETTLALEHLPMLS